MHQAAKIVQTHPCAPQRLLLLQQQQLRSSLYCQGSSLQHCTILPYPYQLALLPYRCAAA
jgi:hypothetical protein